jgi:signal transduction histidine kinase
MRSGLRRGGDVDVHLASTRPPTRAARLAGYVGNVFSSVSARRAAPAPEQSVGDVAPSCEDTAHWPSRGWRDLLPGDPSVFPPVLEAVRVLVLVMVLATVPLANPHPGPGPRGITVAVTLGVSIIAWICWMRSGMHYRVMAGSLIVMGLAGGILAGLSWNSPAIAIGCVVTSAAGARMSSRASLAITAETVAAFVITGVIAGAPAGTLAGYSGAFIGLWAFGLTRRAYILRAEQAEQALEQARRAHVAETQAAALAERARIAREIHDVLAHSLGAVSVNLQAAEGLLGELPAGRPELAKAIECVERAGAFTREGLAEARRAILALRDGDGDGAAPAAPRPLTEHVRALAEEFRADGDTPVELTVTGEPRPVGAEAGLTIYRTVQEALTNARKHAPGQPVTVTLEFTPSRVTATIVNPLPPAGAPRPLAGAGSGYGLVGVRERAALGGGSLIAGPAGDEWRVSLTIPA